MKLDSKTFARKCYYWQNFPGYLLMSKEPVFFKVSISDGISSFRVFLPVDSHLVLCPSWKSVYIEVQSKEMFRSELRSFSDFILSCNSKQLKYYKNLCCDKYGADSPAYDNLCEFIVDCRTRLNS